MKRFFWAFIAASVLFACDPISNNTDDPDKEQTDPDNNGDNNGSTGENGGNGENEEPELQPDEQKLKLQSVGMEIMDLCPANEFEHIANLAEAFDKKYFVDSYDWEALSKWFDDQIDTAYEENDSETTNGVTTTRDYYFKLVILLSNHKGLITLNDSKAVVDNDFDGTKVAFNLDGKTYEAFVQSSGKVSEAYFVYNDEGVNTGESYDWETDSYKSYIDIFKDVYEFRVHVPENITIKITENGKDLLDVSAEFTPKFTASGLNLTTDSFASTISAKLNGYEIVLENVNYDGTSGKAGFTRTLKKDNKVILTTKASADVSLETTTEEYSEAGTNYTISNTYTIVKANKAKNVVAEMDILDQIQVKGTCSNAIDASESLDKMWDALSTWDSETQTEKTPNETEAKRHLDNFNAKMKFDLFYDHGSIKQAGVKFDLEYQEHEEDWDNDGVIDERWENYDLIPIIEFNDGSKYKVEEFFTGDAFSEIIDAFDALCSSYERVFGYIIEAVE